MTNIKPDFDPASWLNEHGDYLYRYALLQLRDEHAAEDAVQETLLAALNAWARFSGQSTVRTWLTGILKHKILDIFRRQAKEPQLTPGSDQLDDLEALENLLFKANGHWAYVPQPWGEPETVLDQKRFWEAFTHCLEQLAPTHAKVFHLRELDGFTTEDICKELEITPTNCWVMLHRARLGLQQCLENRLGSQAV